MTKPVDPSFMRKHRTNKDEKYILVDADLDLKICLNDVSIIVFIRCGQTDRPLLDYRYKN